MQNSICNTLIANTLKFSFVARAGAMSSIEVPVDDGTEYSVSLKLKVSSMADVVLGYGRQKWRRFADSWVGHR